jgi:hypothetical protein
MVEFLLHRGSDRKHRLFACCQARRLWDRLPGEASRRAIEVVEQYADGQVTEEVLSAAGDAARAVPRPETTWSDRETWRLSCRVTEPQGWLAAQELCGVAFAIAPGSDALRKADDLNRIPVLRCIFGNPFRPITLDPVYRTRTTVSLAQAAYDERLLPGGELDPVRLGVLADALEEADAPGELLTHLRGPGPHVRGCFAIDQVLKKE